jgi:hypothetical protein
MFAYGFVARTIVASHRNGITLDSIYVEKGSHARGLVEFLVGRGYRENDLSPETSQVDAKVCSPKFPL